MTVNRELEVSFCIVSVTTDSLSLTRMAIIKHQSWKCLAALCLSPQTLYKSHGRHQTSELEVSCRIESVFTADSLTVTRMTVIK